MLSQVDEEGNEYALSFASKNCNHAEKNYTSYDWKCLAVVWGVGPPWGAATIGMTFHGIGKRKEHGKEHNWVYPLVLRRMQRMGKERSTPS